LYAQKGFEGETLEKIVEVITANPDVWVEVMMSEEHQLQPPSRQGGAIKSSNSKFKKSMEDMIKFCHHEKTSA
jgi:hypothetical protein